MIPNIGSLSSCIERIRIGSKREQKYSDGVCTTYRPIVPRRSAEADTSLSSLQPCGKRFELKDTWKEDEPCLIHN